MSSKNNMEHKKKILLFIDCNVLIKTNSNDENDKTAKLNLEFLSSLISNISSLICDLKTGKYILYLMLFQQSNQNKALIDVELLRAMFKSQYLNFEIETFYLNQNDKTQISHNNLLQKFISSENLIKENFSVCLNFIVDDSCHCQKFINILKLLKPHQILIFQPTNFNKTGFDYRFLSVDNVKIEVKNNISKHCLKCSQHQSELFFELMDFTMGIMLLELNPNSQNFEQENGHFLILNFIKFLFQICFNNLDFQDKNFKSKLRTELIQMKSKTKNQKSFVNFVQIGENKKVNEIENFMKEDSCLVGNSKKQAIDARFESMALQEFSVELRYKILSAIASSLIENESEILSANTLDIKAADANKHLSEALKSRLSLTSKKIKTLAKGIDQIVKDCQKKGDPVGRILSRTEISPGFILQEETAPIGVLLVIFESRPDCLPQIASLAIMSGNGLLLKGGKEALHSNRFLHKLIGDCIENESKGKIRRNLIGLVETRFEIQNLLKLDDVIDLCIPRGSNKLVNYIQNNTNIPVLGHDEGVCHVYIDKCADFEKAKRVVIDSKLNYPAACNSVEKILVHSSLVEDGFCQSLIDELIRNNIQLYGGPKIRIKFPRLSEWKSPKIEYSNLSLSLEIADTLEDAIKQIHLYGSGHTESIVTENIDNANKFLNNIDSACIFHNASTRFADGYRFGLGAEVGISTKKIHKRGPVGIQGLLTSRQKGRSNSSHIVEDFDTNILHYSHKSMPVLNNIKS